MAQSYKIFPTDYTDYTDFFYFCRKIIKLYMKKLSLLILAMVIAGMAKAEDGHQLWLRQTPVNKAVVNGPECVAAQELRTYSKSDVTLKLDASMEQDAYILIR